MIRSNDKTKISSCIKFLFLFLFILKYKKTDKIIIQTRSVKDQDALYWLKMVFKNIKVICDYRGAIAEEYINSINCKSIDSVIDKKIINKYNSIINEQEKMFIISDKIFCVSHKLKDYVNKIYNHKFSNKLIVIPGGADKKHFFMIRVYDIKYVMN